MAIGTLAAVALGVGAIGSAAISSGASGRAANAATQAADQSAAVTREQLNAARTALAPWQQTGLAASNQINALLGLPVQQQQPPTVNALTGDVTQIPRWVSRWGGDAINELGIGGSNFLGDNTVYGSAGTASPTATAPAANPWDGFKNYLAGSDYAFQLDRGANRVNSGYAGEGTLKSGAAMKALEDYRQNLQAGYRGEYLGALGNQQQLGIGAASALAGVSQNAGNSLAQIYTNRGDAIANAALANGRNMTNMLGGLTSGILRYGT